MKNGNGRPHKKIGAKTPSKTPMVVPPHGNGLLQIGNPGNAGGGRPASQIRERCRGSFERRIPVLEQIADGKGDDSDRLKAVDLLGKYGLDSRTQLGISEIKERLRATVAIIREELGPEVAEPIIARIKGEWAA